MNPSTKDIDTYFKELRFNENYHLGLGDIRLTIGQQKEIVDEFSKLRESYGLRIFDLEQALKLYAPNHELLDVFEVSIDSERSTQ